MKTAAIICEYNPFHNGHIIQIHEIKRTLGDDTVIISLMSGSTVQRGGLSIYPKHARAKAAVMCGSDLVLELPCPYSCGSAEYFAKGAVTLLDKLGGIDFLCFGSESGDIDELSKTAHNIASEEYLSALRSSDTSESHQRNAENIYRSMFSGDYPTLPNDILGVEYIASLNRINSKIKPFTYKRLSGFSATKSRKAINEGELPLDMIPEPAINVFSNVFPTKDTLCSQTALYLIRSTENGELQKFYGMNGGVSGCLKNNSYSVSSIDELITLCTSRKYSASRLRRAVMSMLIGIIHEDMTAEPMAANLLAANSAGLKYLSEIKKTSGISVITKNSDRKKLSKEADRNIEFCRRADELFCLSREEPPSDIIRKAPFIK